jgi:adenosine deaminase
VDLRALPKVELHRHLDGSVRMGTILELARGYGLDVGADTVEGLRERATVRSPMKDLEAVLDCFKTLQSVLCSPEAIGRVTFENIEDAWWDGVVLLELRFSPAFMARGHELSYDDIIGGILEANFDALRDLIRWKSCGAEAAKRICGFDLADGEDEPDPRSFVPMVDEAREAGLGITIHSGENTSPLHVLRTLDLFRPRRIGHGIKAWGDEAAVERLREEDVMLEVSPTSNWLTSSVPSLEEHPLPMLYRAGVPVSINSDDPNLMDIDLVNEYEVCRRAYGFTEEDFHKINRSALEHSFLSREIRERVLARHFRGALPN